MDTLYKKKIYIIPEKNATSSDIQNKGLLFRKRLNPVQLQPRLADFTPKHYRVR